MSSLKQLKAEQKTAAHYQQVVEELNVLVKDVERCERTIMDLKAELATINTEHQNRKTTREDIAYLEALLDCAKKKLTWEKHLESLRKRTPPLLERMTALFNDPQHPASEETRSQMLSIMQTLQAAMERLQAANVQ
jgi:hypothetical protein